jgi:hypothetical protein
MANEASLMKIGFDGQPVMDRLDSGREPVWIDRRRIVEIGFTGGEFSFGHALSVGSLR